MGKWFENVRSSVICWSHSKSSGWAMFACALLDACCLPLPTPMFFISLVLLNKPNAYKYAIYAATGALTGAVIGYLIGYFAWLNSDGEFSKFALFVFDYVPGFSVETYALIKYEFDKWNYWILTIASFLPVPYKIFSISSGVFHINIIAFSVTTFIGKILTFCGLAFLTIKIGEKTKNIIRVNMKPIALLVFAGIVIGLIVIKIL